MKGVEIEESNTKTTSNQLSLNYSRVKGAAMEKRRRIRYLILYPEHKLQYAHFPMISMVMLRSQERSFDRS